MSISPIEIGWMVGLVDVKGRLQYKNNKLRATQQATLAIDSSSMAIIEKLATLTGVRAYVRPAQNAKEWMQRRCVEHCPEKHDTYHHHLDWPQVIPETGRWAISGAAMAIVLHSLVPYLSEREKWSGALSNALENSVLSGQGSGQTLQAIRRLRSLGWDLPELFAKALEKRDAKEKVA